MTWLIINLFSIICGGTAAYLAANSLEGWGWFLFVGLLGASTATSVKVKV